jgi:hypothetical protein
VELLDLIEVTTHGTRLDPMVEQEVESWSSIGGDDVMFLVYAGIPELGFDRRIGLGSEGRDHNGRAPVRGEPQGRQRVMAHTVMTCPLVGIRDPDTRYRPPG